MAATGTQFKEFSVLSGEKNIKSCTKFANTHTHTHTHTVYLLSRTTVYTSETLNFVSRGHDPDIKFEERLQTVYIK